MPTLYDHLVQSNALGKRDYASEPLANPSSTGSHAASTGIGSFLGGTLGAIGGGIVGAGAFGLGAAPGAIAGGGAGSALGDYLEQLITHPDHKVDLGNVGLEGTLGLAGGVGGKVIGLGAKGLRAASATKVGLNGLSAIEKAAPEAAAVAGVGKNIVQKGLTGLGDTLAVRGLKATPSQLSNFAKSHGEDITKVISRNGLEGANADQIYTKAIAPAQAAFDSVAKNSVVPITKREFGRQVAEAVRPLTSSTLAEEKALGQKVLQETSNIANKFKGGKLSLAEATTLRKSYDAATKSFASDPMLAGKNRAIGTILRQVIQNTADNAGLKAGGKTLKDAGKELSKLYDLHTIATKQENIGRGTLPFGLTALLGSGAGASMGGLPGAAVGLAATKALNSRAAISAASRAATALGNGTAGIGAKIGAAGKTLGPMAEQAVAHMANPARYDGTAATPDMAANPAATGTDTTAQLGAPQAQAVGSSSAFTPETLQALAIHDIQTTGGKNLDKIATLEKLFGSSSGSKKAFNNATANTLTDAGSAVNQLTELSKAISAGAGSTGPLSGRLRSANPYDTGQQGLQAQIDATRQIVGKFLEGGVLRKEDEVKYAKILPTTNDTRATALKKIEIVRQMVAARAQQYQGLVGAGNAGTYDLSSITGAQ